MAKAKASSPIVIKGPIGMGAPFKMHYNSDGSPNYVMSVRSQQQIANRRIPERVSRVDPKSLDRGSGYVSNYVRNLQSKINSMQEVRKKLNESLGKVHPMESPSGKISHLTIARSSDKPQPNKDEPAIKR